MANINYAFKEISCKIVYYGPGLCGKTTNLQAIHDNIPPKFRGDLVSLATEQDRTLFFDFLPLDLGEVRGFKTKFQLYTVPGQVYYNATRRLVLRGVDGVVFVADSTPDKMEENRESITNLRENLESYGLNLDEMPWVIQFNKRDLPNAVAPDEMEAILNPDRVPSFEAVAVKGIGVKETLKGIAALVLRRLREMAEATPPGGGSVLEQRAAASQAGSRSQKLSLSSSAGAAPPRPTPTPAPAPAVPRAPVQAVPSIEAVEPAASAAAPEPAVPVGPARESPPAPAKAPPRPEGEAARPRAQAAPPDLHVLQKCDLRWHGLRIGTAVVEISRRANVDRQAPFAMTCETSCLGLFQGSWNCLLNWDGEQAKVVDFRKVPFYVFSEVEQQDRKSRIAQVWVKNAFDKACYVSYSGFGGAIRLTPAGREWIG